MHVVSIANFILLASSVSLCALRPTTLASRLKARNYRNYAFRLAFHANAASLEYRSDRLAPTCRGDGK